MRALAGTPFVVALAGVVTLALFLLMQGLISLGIDDVPEKRPERIAEFTMPEHELNVIEKTPKPEKPLQPESPPPEVDLELENQSVSESQPLPLASVNMQMDVSLSGIGLGVSDGEYLPLVRPPPSYPRYAQSRGIEGYVIIEFTVTPNGKVVDPVIIEGDPPGVFDHAALRAVKAYKYKPKIVDGAPVAVTGVRQKFTFKLDQS